MTTTQKQSEGNGQRVVEPSSAPVQMQPAPWDDEPEKPKRKIDRTTAVFAAVFAGVGLLLVVATFVLPGLSSAPTAEVVVAAVDIPAGVVVEESMLTTSDLDAAFVESSEDVIVDPADVVGKPARGGITAGSPLLAYAVADAAGDNPNAQRFALSLPASRFVNGLVVPGDTIDVYATFSDQQTLYGAWVAENIPVVSAESVVIETEDAEGVATLSEELSLILEAPPSAAASILQASVLGETSGTFAAKSTGMPPGHLGQLLNWQAIQEGPAR